MGVGDPKVSPLSTGIMRFLARDFTEIKNAVSTEEF